MKIYGKQVELPISVIMTLPAKNANFSMYAQLRYMYIHRPDCQLVGHSRLFQSTHEEPAHWKRV